MRDHDYDANTGQVLRVCNRAGERLRRQGFDEVFFGNCSINSTPRLHERVLEMCMDGAFFREDVIDVLEAKG